ncbi:MAG: NAD(P)/FAD-dependent oxidoreductase [Gammaproteobacteria bacterium]|nr:NAD(P)/FAD-dependent oxidoreductase [Gammaproteobacteria bacterium]
MPEYSCSESLPSSTFDVIVVGSGVVGCAMARRFTLEGARVLVIEKAADILDGASKANSAILHTGFDAPPPGSLEQACLVDGYREYLDIHARLNLPLLECGALVLAWNPDEADRLGGILQNAHRNGVTSTRILNARQVLSREPAVADSVVAALEVAGESVVDPWSAPYAYLLQAIKNGASLVRNCELLGGEFDGIEWSLQTSRGQLRAQRVINCAGLYGDRVDQMLIGESKFEIHPRKGQFVVFDKSARDLLSSILLPVPTEITKGIVVCPTLFGNLLVGPTAEEQQSRSDSGVDTTELHALVERGRHILPALRRHDVTATYAGIRPASEHKDYQIQWYPERNYCCVGGIRSTGLSAALGIASYVYHQYEDSGHRHAPLANCQWPRVAQIADPGPRDWQQPGNGGIVCHCELVTRREIENALDGPLKPGSLAGLKRRTRVTMGRCQGFYCSAELCELTEGRFKQPLAVAHK